MRKLSKLNMEIGKALKQNTPHIFLCQNKKQTLTKKVSLARDADTAKK